MSDSDSDGNDSHTKKLDEVFGAFDSLEFESLNITPAKLKPLIKRFLPQAYGELGRQSCNSCAEMVGMIKKVVEWESQHPVQMVYSCFDNLQKDAECDLSTLLEHLKSLVNKLATRPPESDSGIPTLRDPVQVFGVQAGQQSSDTTAVMSSPTELRGVSNANYFTIKCASCGNYPLNSPMQLPCGDRLCGSCYNTAERQAMHTAYSCSVCEIEVDLKECFRDRAIERELRFATLCCLNPGCPWEGKSEYYQEHKQFCKFVMVDCPNQQFGCQEKLVRSSMEEHLLKCRYSPVRCQWCGLKVQDEMAHTQNECNMVLVTCPNGCGEKLQRKEMKKHMCTMCTHAVRQCEFHDMGCKFMGNVRELAKHTKEKALYHNQLMRKANQDLEQALKAQVASLDRQIAATRTEVTSLQSETSMKVQSVVDTVIRTEATIHQLQEGFSEMALMVQTLQATSYNGIFIWKIPEIQRRRHEARTGKTVSLYSAPFYTSRHGYKLCLRLYMDGDGSGKGTHLSFFITIMRGEYDALLPWPFQQTVKLKLLDQDKQEDIVQSFCPEPSSSSFQRPTNDMNVASGCPTFAPISVLSNSSYVKDDTMFLKCIVDTSTLLEH